MRITNRQMIVALALGATAVMVGGFILLRDKDVDISVTDADRPINVNEPDVR